MMEIALTRILFQQSDVLYVSQHSNPLGIGVTMKEEAGRAAGEPLGRSWALVSAR